MRYLTAGESHGPALVTICEGLPAGLPVALEAIARELTRRRLGYGRSPRMGFEEDRLEILAGVRHGRTLGSPVALVVHNTEWPKWVEAMSSESPKDPEAVASSGRGQPLTRPRPGHADLVGSLKYDYDDVRDALERASARETAARTAVGALAKTLLAEVGVSVISHVVDIGGESVGADLPVPGPGDRERVDASPVRTFDPEAEARMTARIDKAAEDNSSVGGVIEVIGYGLPPGLGSHVHWDRKLDARLGAACLSVQAMKGVEFGLGFSFAGTPGHEAHDEIFHDGSTFWRKTNRAGGLEAGMTTGEPLVLRIAMKPLSSLTRPLQTVDTATKQSDVAITQRSDVCAVPRAGVVLEAVVAIELADALLEKTGGDTVDEVRRNLTSYLERLAGRSSPPTTAQVTRDAQADIGL
ncbi:MAG: chorismate synthase [Actinomycetota bacterium]|nr:chorismate synthase [Actinomycetota bacterium]